MPGPGVDAGLGPPGGKNPAGCYWSGPYGNEQVRSAAPSATAQYSGILRVFRTSLTSTSAFRGRPVRMGAAPKRDQQLSRRCSGRDRFSISAASRAPQTPRGGPCQRCYCPCSFWSLSTPLRLPLVLNAVGKDRFRPQIRPYARFRPLSSQFSYPPWRMVNILRGGSLGGPLSTKVRRQLRMVVATAVLSGSAKDEIRV